LKLTIGSTTMEVPEGYVCIIGSFVVLAYAGGKIKYGYCIRQGETLRQVSEDEYVVEY